MTMVDSFGAAHVVLLTGSIVCALVATIFNEKGRVLQAILILTVGTLLLRLFAATLDPFLNQWDECFHAVVARNMIQHPLTPMLQVEPLMSASPHWIEAHIWLHKPPFFLWQMALSIELFGAEPWAVRIPSALWLTLLVPVVHRMGRLLSGPRVAWIAAVLLSFSYYLEELAAGGIGTDHNDAVFIALVACSWWTLLELWNDRRSHWAILTGLFSACAILTKWYVGGIVFLPWLLSVFMDPVRKQAMRGLLIGAVSTIVLVGAWIGVMLIRFTKEATYEWYFKASHFSQVIDGHTGPWDYHFDAIRIVLPPFTPWTVVPAFAWLAWKTSKTEHRLFLTMVFISVHLAFGLAATKMIGYTMVLFPLYVVALAQAIDSLAGVIVPAKYRSWVLAVVTLLLAGFMLDLPTLNHRHTIADPRSDDQRWRQQQLDAIAPLKSLAAMIPNPGRSVVFHVPALHHIQFMFNTGIGSSNRLPDRATVDLLVAKGYCVYVVQDGVAPEAIPQGTILIADSALRFPNVGRPE